MRLTLHQSWRQSLAAVALVTMFGNGGAPAAAMPNELLLGYNYEPAQKEHSDTHEMDEHAHAIKQKLAAIEKLIRDHEEKGDLEETKKLYAGQQELRAALEKIAAARSAAKASNKLDAGAKEKRPLDVDALHERLKQLEAENAKLRTALKELGRKSSGGEEEKLADVNRYRRELSQMHEKLMKEHHADQKDLPLLHEKLKQVAEERDKLKMKEKLADDARLHQEMRKLAESAEKVRAEEHHQKMAVVHSQEFVAMLKELREEVTRLRNEVSDLRKMVRDGGDSKDRAR
jgi:uncharacterized phage infection (PIP) family protein YhgE